MVGRKVCSGRLSLGFSVKTSKSWNTTYMKSLVALISMFVFTQSVYACERQSKAAEVFLNAYINQDDNLSARDWLEASGLTTNAFLAAYDALLSEAYRENPDYGLGYDPITQSQDTPDRYIATHCEGNKVHLEGKAYPQFTADVSLVEVDNVWLVNESGSVSIQNLSQEALK